MKELTTSNLHLQFASVRDDVQKQRDLIVNRCSASFYWCNEYFEASTWLLPTEQQVRQGKFDDPDSIVASLQLLTNGASDIFAIREVFEKLQTEDMERLTYGVEIGCAISIAVADMVEESDEEISMEDAYDIIDNQAKSCDDCERTLSYLILSYITEVVTMPMSACAAIAHSENEFATSEYKDKLMAGLDLAYIRASEAGK